MQQRHSAVAVAVAASAAAVACAASNAGGEIIFLQ